MKYELYPYQKDAVSKLIWAQQLEGADLAVLPTGAGKSIVIAELAHKINKRTLVLQPGREILQQNFDKMSQYVAPTELGVYSASMDRKDLGFFTFATIQSVYKKPEIFQGFTLVIIDECHLVNPKNLEGMYTRFFQEMGDPKIIGLTATPYRMDQFYERLPNGGILTHTTTKLINRMKERFWSRLVYNINNHELVDTGYLVPLRYIDKTIIEHAEIPTNISKSDFNLEAYEKKIEDEEDKIIDAIYFAKELGKSVLVFCSSVDQAERLAGIVEGSDVVSAKTSKKKRAQIVNDFKNQKLHVVFNVGVLTTGFDHPELDCIVLLRPTRSIGLYYQMLGRGVRRAVGKKYCNVIDLTGTVKALGRIETIKLVKMNLWELVSERGSWHKRPLYSFKIQE